MRILVLTVSFLLTCFTHAQINISKAGNGWDKQIDSALLLIKSTDIEKYQLIDKKRILAVTKCDLLDAELERELERELKLKMRGRNRIPVVFISAQTQHRIQELKDLIWKQIND